MDAQNANEAAPPKPSASSASSRLLDPDRQKASSSSSAVTKPPTFSRTAPPSSSAAKDQKPSSASTSKLQPGPSSSSTATSNEPSKASGAKASSASLSRDPKDVKKPSTLSSREKQRDDDGGTDGSSEAETIVLDKDGSPAKPRNRKVIKHEDKANGAPSSSAAAASATATAAASVDSVPPSRRHAGESKDGQPDRGGRSAVDFLDGPPKKKRLHDKLQSNSNQSHARAKDPSSSLSSAPGSPPRSRNASTHPQSGSDTDHIHRPKSPRRALSTASKDRLRPPEKLVPYKRKASRDVSDDDGEFYKARRQRLANASAAASLEVRSSKDSSRPGHNNSLGKYGGSTSLTKSLASRASRDASPNRSVSPQPRSHRRSLSTHAISQSNGLGIKKKCVPAPLQTTDYHSDESSASGSPRVRSAKLRNLTAPAESSPAKIVAHKKHLDAHGQTYLARACARGEYDLAKQRLQERPEDLNVADFAGNTPLQIAALNGFGNIVKLLIDAGCNLDCVNHDKDTPLLDAVDNGHLEVVQLLLDAGVNPRKANVNGEEPLDRVDDTVDNADAIRTALMEARKKVGERRLTSEEHRHENDDLRFLQGLDESPRRSPAPGGSTSSRRTGTIRATKTSNHLLYMPMDDKTLRLAAGRGDEQNVTRILQVRDAFDDPESMVAASRGGHDVVLQLLLALGRANPDPAPITNVPPEHATPILAAIGQENLKVVSLLLEQSNFDPTKRFNGDTYYEIARKRAGPNWKEEEDILKNAYDAYKKSHGNKTKSPPRKSAEARRAARAAEPSDETAAPRALKRKLSSPSLERPKKTTSSTKATVGSVANPNSREEKGGAAQKRAEQSAAHADRHSSPKRTGSSTISARSNPRDDRSSVTSNPDRDTSPPSKQVSKSRKTDSDSVAMSSEGETAKPRRKKLVSGRELKDGKVREKERERELEKQRRSSMASTNTATPSKDSASPRESRHDDLPTEKARVDKHRERDRDRARQLKKEDSKESSGSAGDGSGKRHRLSETPPNAVSSDKDASEAPVKRRRLDADNAATKDKGKKAAKTNAASDDLPGKSLPSISVSSKAIPRRREESSDDRKASVPATSGLKAKKREASSDRARKDTLKPSVAPTEKSIHVKSEDVDVEMADLNDARPSNGLSSADAKAQREKEEEKKKKAEAESKKKDEELLRRRKEEEDKKKKEIEEKKRKEEEKHKREEEEAERLKKEEEKKKEADEKKKKEDEEKLKRKKQEEEEERQRKEEERKRKAEEDKKRREEEELRRAEEERKRKLEEEQRKKREEEERLRKEQLAREAAAKEAQLKREEEERQERLRREQEQQERERVRAEKEAEERRLQSMERERQRIASLPPVLRWLSTHANPKQSELANHFKVMQGVRYDCINTDANGTPEGREQWLVNTQVALLFGDKDLGLSQYPSWRRLPASRVAKQIIWNLESDTYALTDPLLFDLGKQLPDFYGVQGPRALGSMGLSKIRNDASDKFFATDMFFVKASDVMATIPSLPYLRHIRVAMEYRELPEHESQLLTLAQNPKWKSDPDSDKNLGFAPGTKYFVNGAQIGENRPGLAEDIKTPPRAVRVPRRGFVSVPVDDPEFEIICREQNIDPLSFPAFQKYKSKLQNGVPKVNGQHPMTNGAGASLPNGQALPSPVNGINGTRKH